MIAHGGGDLTSDWFFTYQTEFNIKTSDGLILVKYRKYDICRKPLKNNATLAYPNDYKTYLDCPHTKDWTFSFTLYWNRPHN